MLKVKEHELKPLRRHKEFKFHKDWTAFSDFFWTNCSLSYKLYFWTKGAQSNIDVAKKVNNSGITVPFELHYLYWDILIWQYYIKDNHFLVYSSSFLNRILDAVLSEIIKNFSITVLAHSGNHWHQGNCKVTKCLDRRIEFFKGTFRFIAIMSITIAVARC